MTAVARCAGGRSGITGVSTVTSSCAGSIHAHPEMLQAYRLTLTQAMQRMHIMESDGRMVSGAAAFIAMWRRLPRYRPLAWVVSLPGVFWLTEKAYSRFARWRWKGRCDQVCGKP